MPSGPDENAMDVIGHTKDNDHDTRRWMTIISEKSN